MRIQQSIHLLSSYSLVSVRGSVDAFFMHPLIHFWAQERLSLEEQQNLAREATELISRGLRLKKEHDSLVSYLDFERRIIPHLDAALNNVQKIFSSGHQTDLAALPTPKEPIAKGSIYLVYEIIEGWYMWLWGIIDDIIRYIRLYYRLDIESHSEVWQVAYRLGSVYRSHSLNQNAKCIFRWALREAITRLHRRHPTALTIVGDLAWVIYLQGRDDEALEWYNWTLAARSRVFGKTHPSTLGAIKGIASVLKSQRKFKAALELYHEALEGRENALGKDDSLTLNVVIDIARVFHDQRQYNETLE